MNYVTNMIAFKMKWGISIYLKFSEKFQEWRLRGLLRRKVINITETSASHTILLWSTCRWRRFCASVANDEQIPNLSLMFLLLSLNR